MWLYTIVLKCEKQCIGGYYDLLFLLSSQLGRPFGINYIGNIWKTKNIEI